MAKNIFVGKLDKKVVQLLNLDIKPETPLFIGETNIQHIIETHPEDYNKYFPELLNIISSPDFLAYLPSKNSIEYIKIINNKHVLVPVRITNGNKLFVKTLFGMEDEKVSKYKNANALIDYKSD